MTTNDKIMKLELIRDISIDQIVELYKDGFKLEQSSLTSTSNCPKEEILFWAAFGFIAHLVISKKNK